jgi:hypothetical protein
MYGWLKYKASDLAPSETEGLPLTITLCCR